MVELDFTYSKEEYTKAVREYLIAAKIISKVNIVFVVLFTAFSTLYLFVSNFDMISIVAWVVAVLGLIVGILTYVVMPSKKFNQTSKFHEPYT